MDGWRVTVLAIQLERGLRLARGERSQKTENTITRTRGGLDTPSSWAELGTAPNRCRRDARLPLGRAANEPMRSETSSPEARGRAAEHCDQARMVEVAVTLGQQASIHPELEGEEVDGPRRGSSGDDAET